MRKKTILIQTNRKRERFFPDLEGLYLRWLNKVRKLENGCWEWSGSITKSRCNYGAILINGRNYGAHRVGLALAYGYCPPNMDVSHLCHYKPCVNPDHLRWATQAENIRQSFLDGKKGVNSKLALEQVREIKMLLQNSDRFHREIAEEYGVTRRQVSNIAEGRRWAWA